MNAEEPSCLSLRQILKRFARMFSNAAVLILGGWKCSDFSYNRFLMMIYKDLLLQPLNELINKYLIF